MQTQEQAPQYFAIVSTSQGRPERVSEIVIGRERAQVALKNYPHAVIVPARINPAALLASTTSPAKAATSAANGRKGGRPKKQPEK